ncbi:MAG TPA: SpoIID/LytB domain-containing protein [Geomobilimonas sp.]|nr:SpoIID/LytB domain-containing protein [Geomobilimonas sp.]
MKILFSILFSLCIISRGVGWGEPLHADTIRVALQKGSETVRLDGTGVLAIADDGTPLRLNLPVQLKRDRDGVSVNGRTVRKLVASAPAFLLINGKGYRGTVEITPADKGLLVVNELSLDEYLTGLINCEISSQWPMEAVKAQAVIARSYAVYQREARKNALYHLESSVLDQVYEGCDIEDSRAARGVQETAGEVLTYDGNVIQAFYHSNCGGHTEASENVWGFPLPYLRGVDCAYCETAPSLKWEQTLSLKKIESQLKNSGYQVAGLRDIRLGRRNASGRLVDLMLVTATGRQTMPATRFRMAIGSTVIKSTNFEVRIAGENAMFSGAGYGHGVGLCQWGAKQRASDGFDYREILSYYYPGTQLAKIFGN